MSSLENVGGEERGEAKNAPSKNTEKNGDDSKETIDEDWKKECELFGNTISTLLLLQFVCVNELMEEGDRMQLSLNARHYFH